MEALYTLATDAGIRHVKEESVMARQTESCHNKRILESRVSIIKGECVVPPCS